MTYEEFNTLWASLDEDQRQSVRDKASWEHMTLWAVCHEWPGIWNDEYRLGEIRAAKSAGKE